MQSPWTPSRLNVCPISASCVSRPNGPKVVESGHAWCHSQAMKLFNKSLRRGVSPMIFEAKGQPPVQNATEEQVRALVLDLRVGGAFFASLTDEAGNYIQIAGSRPWCVIECRRLKPLQHVRAFQATPTPKYNDGAKLQSGAGSITLRHDEWFLLKDAADIFAAFLRKDDFPAHVQWRSMNERLGLN